MAKKGNKSGSNQSSELQKTIYKASSPTRLQKFADSVIGKSPSSKILEGEDSKRETTRSTLSRNFVWGYFISIFIVLWISYQKNFEVSGYKDMLLAVSGVLSGPLGFIIGYYFKSESNK